MDDEARMWAWAEREAAKLPPFTAEEAAEVGRLAARIDARRTTQPTGQQAA
jgi:hypothetical protein